MGGHLSMTYDISQFVNHLVKLLVQRSFYQNSEYFVTPFPPKFWIETKMAADISLWMEWNTEQQNLHIWFWLDCFYTVILLTFIVGEIESWFVKLPENQNKNLRLAVSKKNFCLLDSTYEIYQDFQFKTVKCDVSFNSGTDTLELKVYTDVGEDHPGNASIVEIIIFCEE